MRRHYDEREEYYDDEDEGGLDLVDLIFALLRRWKVIILVAIPIIIAGFFVASTRPTVYRSETTLMVSAGNGLSVDGSDIGEGQKFITTYIQLAKSRDIMERVIAKYDLAETPSSLAAKVTVSPVANTDFLKLSYRSGERGLTTAVTNEIANEFIFKISQVLKVRNISVIERASEASQMPKNRGIIIIASFILGMVLGTGVASVIELVHRKLRKSSDIEKILKSQMLGMIPEIEIADKGEESHES